MCNAPRPRALFGRLNFLNFQKCSRPGVLLAIFTSTCAVRRNRVRFLDGSTSKSAPDPRGFYNFQLEMRFETRNRGHFLDGPTSQKCSEHEVRLKFSLRNVLRATAALFQHLSLQNCFWLEVLVQFSLHNLLCAMAACAFWTAQLPKSAPSMFDFHFDMCFTPQMHALFGRLNFQNLPKVLWTQGAFTLITWQCGLQHSRAHFLDGSTSKSALDPRGFYNVPWAAAARNFWSPIRPMVLCPPLDRFSLLFVLSLLTLLFPVHRWEVRL